MNISAGHEVEALKVEVMSRFTFEGIHNWPEAPDDVWYLQHEHRHLFHVLIAWRVSHLKRQVEFISAGRDVKDNILGKLTQRHGIYILEDMSCEQLAELLLDQERDASWVEIWEDGENGARVSR